MKVEELSLPDSTEIPDDTIVPMMTCLAALQSALAARLLARNAKSPADEADRLLTINQAAAKLQTSKDWIYRNQQSLPFVVRIGKNLRFSENGIETWIRSRTGKTPNQFNNIKRRVS